LLRKQEKQKNLSHVVIHSIAAGIPFRPACSTHRWMDFLYRYNENEGEDCSSSWTHMKDEKNDFIAAMAFQAHQSVSLNG